MRDGDVLAVRRVREGETLSVCVGDVIELVGLCRCGEDEVEEEEEEEDLGGEVVRCCGVK